MFIGLAVLLATLVAFSDCNRDDRVLLFDGYAIYKNPAQLPEAFPRAFRPPQARIIQVAVYNREPYLSAAEGVAEFEMTLEMPEALKHYQNAFSEAGWQIIQSHLEPKRSLLIAESPSRRLATLILTEDSALRGILFIRQASLL